MWRVAAGESTHKVKGKCHIDPSPDEAHRLSRVPAMLMRGTKMSEEMDMLRKSLAIMLAMGMVSPALAAETTLTSSLSGSGSGSATFKVDPAKGEVCYELQVVGVDGAVAAHIHKGAAGSNGPPVVSLDAPGGGKSSGCK